MTVPNTTSAVQYNGTGLISVYPYNFQIAQQTDLIVWEWVPATGVATKLTIGTDYTVQGVGIQAGGTVTLLAGNLPAGTSAFIGTDPLEVQLLLLQQSAAFNPADIMNALDLLTREVQAVRRIANNSIQFPVFESLLGLNSVLGSQAMRANSFLYFDSNGNATTTGGITGLAYLAADQTFTGLNTFTRLVTINAGSASQTLLQLSAGSGPALDILSVSTGGGEWQIGDGIGTSNGTLVIYDKKNSRPVASFGSNGNATFSGVTGTTFVGSTFTGSGLVTTSGILSSTNTQAASSTITGCIRGSGGLGLAGGIFCGGGITSGGLLTATSGNFSGRLFTGGLTPPAHGTYSGNAMMGATDGTVAGAGVIGENQVANNSGNPASYLAGSGNNQTLETLPLTAGIWSLSLSGYVTGGGTSSAIILDAQVSGTSVLDNGPALMTALTQTGKEGGLLAITAATTNVNVIVNITYSGSGMAVKYTLRAVRIF